MGFDLFGNIGTVLASPVAEGYEQIGLDKARQTQQQQYGVNKGYYDPYYNAGTGALNRLNGNLQSGAYNVNVTPQNLAGDPGYQFQLQQGQQALERSAAAHGGLHGGGFAKALDNYSQGLASTQYQNAWNRQFQQNQFNYNSLASMAGMGERSAGSLAGLGQNYGNTMAGYDTGEGNLHASAIMGKFQAGGQAADSATSMGLNLATMGMGGGGGGGLGGGGGGGGGGMASPGGGYTSMNPADYGGGIPQQGYGGQSMGSIGYDTIPMQQQSNYGYGGYGGNYSLGNYGGQMMPPQMGGGY